MSDLLLEQMTRSLGDLYGHKLAEFRTSAGCSFDCHGSTTVECGGYGGRYTPFRPLYPSPYLPISAVKPTVQQSSSSQNGHDTSTP
jgi:hypothetical protein